MLMVASLTGFLISAFCDYNSPFIFTLNLEFLLFTEWPPETTLGKYQ